jgi:hypothetical protein
MVTSSNEIWVQDGDEKRKLDGAELSTYVANQALIIAEVAAATEAAKVKVAEKTALLTKLGITEDEAKLLLA